MESITSVLSSVANFPYRKPNSIIELEKLQMKILPLTLFGDLQ
ncbi:unnamed protein product [Linum tenue]|uniref:Uncharacterized protein n=1 Tax=Linum tenue TaxID=586396 RepID=A0AAV0I9R7_9ROSI|nr:unnamed protein product [Linum tenue]